MRVLYGYCCVIALLVMLVSGTAQSQVASSVVAPNIFLRGLQLPQGVRYTATFVPSADEPLRNISVEVTLPAEAQFTEMLISRQVEFDAIRINQAGELTLIWQISRAPAGTPLDAFAFTVAEPLTSDVRFFMKWQDEARTQFTENFLELPPVSVAIETEGALSASSEGFQPVGETGVQVAGSAEVASAVLIFNILPIEFNPPAEYGDIWWCSLLDIFGIPFGESVTVIVPLRRPIAPFSQLQLFQQQTDGTWLPLSGVAEVTADGNYVKYEHTGGAIATGGDPSIQLDSVSASEAEIVQVDGGSTTTQDGSTEATATPAPSAPTASLFVSLTADATNTPITEFSTEKVEIFSLDTNQVIQCQAGEVLCVSLVRKPIAQN
jgi:hypothetical protein